MRLDNYLVNHKNIESRSRAQYLIKEGVIKVNDTIVKKSSFKVKEHDIVEVIENPCIYVSKGGLKLEKAIKVFKIDFTDKIVLDIGASTGGFTHCSLINGASKVYALDVGHSQLHEKLCNDKRVINYEGTNIKELSKALVPEFDIAVVDVSFISLSHVFSALKEIVNDKVILITLIKPQFEAGIRGSSKGVVRLSKHHKRILEDVINKATSYGFYLKDISYSPYKGQAGNIEFLAYFTCNIDDQYRKSIKEIVDEAHDKLS